MTQKQRFKAARRVPPPDQRAQNRSNKRAVKVRRGSGLLLAFLPLLLAPATLFKFFTFRLDQALILVLAMIALGAAASLVRQGLAEQADYDAAAMARAPRPRKAQGFVLIALAVAGSLAWASPMSVATAAFFGGLAGLSAMLAYGLDPMRDKLPERDQQGGDEQDLRATNQRAWKHIEAAEAKITALEATADALDRQILIFAAHTTQPPLDQQVAAIAHKIARVAELAQRVVELVRQDPSDINHARRFFVTYLDQVSQVSDKFQAYADQAKDTAQYQRLADISGAYLRVLETIEAACHEQIERLQAHDLMDLEVQIEVLQTQLDREGLV